MAGRFTASVLAAGTGVELLVSTVVREVGQVRGLDEDRITRILGCGLKNILRQPLPGILRTDIDLDDDTSPWGHWWAHGYAPRNAVAHRGHRPSNDEAQAATYAAMRLVAEVGTLIDADPTLGHLRLGIPTGVADRGS